MLAAGGAAGTLDTAGTLGTEETLGVAGMLGGAGTLGTLGICTFGGHARGKLGGDWTGACRTGVLAVGVDATLEGGGT